MVNNFDKKSSAGRGGCVFFILFMPITFFFVVTIISIVILFTPYKKYKNWQEQFESSVLKSSYLYFDGIDDYDEIGDISIRKADDQKEVIEKIKSKTDRFVDKNSNEKVRTLEFSNLEGHYIIGNSIRNGISKEFDLFRTYLEPNDQVWVLYYQLKFRGVKMPWIVLYISKGDYLSAYPEISRILIGNIDLDNIGLYFIREDINKSIREGYEIFSQNEWSNVNIENIELEKDKIFIKGSAN